MVIGRDYMLKKPAGPSAPKRFLDTRVVPRVVNMAGAAEVALDAAAVRAGIRPSVIVVGVAGMAVFTALRLLTRTRRGTPFGGAPGRPLTAGRA